MKIGTQLTAGAFGIGAIVLVNLGVIFIATSANNAKRSAFLVRFAGELKDRLSSNCPTVPTTS